jgi:hypothetical protein
MFCPDCSPAFIGEADPGIDWYCPKCPVVLAQGVYEDQFLDLLFRCYACGSIGASPTREPGQPFAGRPLLIPPGRYRLGSSVDVVEEPVMNVGQQALDGYLKETGARFPGSNPPQYGLREISSASLRHLASDAAGLLGDRYEDLRKRDRHGQSFKSTPPSRRHRLIELIAFAKEAADRMEQAEPDGSVELDGNQLSELVATVSLFVRWRNHPAWPLLVKTLSSITEGQHSVMVLNVASYLVDAGNGVGLVFKEGKGRIADLWVRPTLLERLDLEVKTPQALRGPRESPLTVAEAEDLIEQQLKKAASTSRGQLSAAHSGILAIGGFHLGEGALDILEKAGARVLARQSDRKGHLAALAFSELSYQVTTDVGASGEAQSAQFVPTLQTRLVRHPGYKGALNIEERPPWQTNSRSGSQSPPNPQPPKNRAARRRATTQGARATPNRQPRAGRRKPRR